MSMAILGAGRVGTTLGRRFAEAGHAVRYGVRAPDDPKHASVPGPVWSIADAAARADVVVLTTSWAGAEATLRAAGDLAGKVLIDATNPIGPGMVLPRWGASLRGGSCGATSRLSDVGLLRSLRIRTSGSRGCRAASVRAE